jgi:hypothetical protein
MIIVQKLWLIFWPWLRGVWWQFAIRFGWNLFPHLQCIVGADQYWCRWSWTSISITSCWSCSKPMIPHTIITATTAQGLANLICFNLSPSQGEWGVDPNQYWHRRVLLNFHHKLLFCSYSCDSPFWPMATKVQGLANVCGIVDIDQHWHWTIQQLLWQVMVCVVICYDLWQPKNKEWWTFAWIFLFLSSSSICRVSCTNPYRYRLCSLNFHHSEWSVCLFVDTGKHW